MKDLLRLASIVLLVVALFVPIRYFKLLLDQYVLTTVGTIAIFVMVLWDLWTGFFLVLAILAMLYRLHVNQLNVFGWISSTQKGDYVETKSLYTTADHLKRAQNNIVDDGDYERELIGIKGVYGEPIYGAQGLDKTMPGFSKEVQGNYPLQ